MNEDINRIYRYLDGELERRALIADIHEVRKTVMQLPDIIPDSLWYVPRYHDWTLAAVLAHLHLIDHLAIFTIRAAMMGIRFPISSRKWDRFNDFMCGTVFKKRIMATTLRGIEKNTARIDELILEMPMNKFTANVHDPHLNTQLTIERAAQEWFLFHWQDHLRAVRETEGLPIEPSERDTLT